MRRYIVLSAVFLIFSCSETKKEEQQNQTSVKAVMDNVITRLYEKVDSTDYDSIDDAFMLKFLTDDEKTTLATRYQYFKVNVPVTVSLMRQLDHKAPFWLKESGFVKTDKRVKNEVNEYEVWEKDFDAGWVNLGIPGFDRNGVIYFISVGSQKSKEELTIGERYPEEYSLEVFKKGAFTYHDWSDLKITELPKELEGQVLFTTVRGRAREAHVEGAFRETIFPSSNQSDQIMLTWSADPTNSMDVQWRTNTTVKDGIVQYWKKNTSDTIALNASVSGMEDRMLYNDRYINRFTANLNNLEAGTTYEYRVGSVEEKSWSTVRDFKTEAKDAKEFSFIWFGDTHRDPKWAQILNDADLRHPETAFYSIAGDIVTTGLYRTEWDMFFGYSKDVFSHRPLMPVPGNHDRQDGLGAWMYYQLFSLPTNGPEKVDPESTYAFKYGNALFLMIDSTQPNEAQTEWIENQLKNSNATWKFVMFHFPPFNFEEPYLDIQQEWGGLFDTYHVDMVMSGHIHYYMRSKPMNNGKVVDSFKDGTVYAVSIGTNGNHDDIGEEPYAEKRFKDGQFYQYMTLTDKTLKYTTYNQDGEIVDELLIKK
ncbi:purple acid phosphatase family protein [Arenibacter echinorum]|uniref:3',5'-cyclic AMP phosphodiesterase CpdA n=1 Tax=Arenibacter echinorum TaxID=440515 RepID=A0A327RCV1_9FLAO|nr:metallophosphoesterase family protein [Arenibacter echinorum]RAJ14038.1 3',5'-cyclic AMP phosphodiesterase CpdA [Arenibacter echinorum]